VRVAVFADVHAHGDALDAVMAAAVDARVSELWCLGDIVGTGPDPARVTSMVRAYCAVALAGNHDYGASGSVDRAAFGPPGSPGRRSLELAAAALETSGDLQWLGSRRPAARRGAVQCWHASPRNPQRGSQRLSSASRLCSSVCDSQARPRRPSNPSAFAPNATAAGVRSERMCGCRLIEVPASTTSWCSERPGSWDA
jgi:hypothetical protein